MMSGYWYGTVGDPTVAFARNGDGSATVVLPGE